MQIITDDKFMEIVDQMLKVGGEWRVSLGKDGCFMTYAGETHAISEKHADVMFQCIPRKCAT